MIRKILQFSVSAWACFLINILSTIVITRYFLPSDYGLINTFSATSTMIMALVCFGFDSGFMRYFYEPPEGYDRNDLLSFSLLLPLVFLVISGMIIIPSFSSVLTMYVFGTSNVLLAALLFVDVCTLLFVRFFTIYSRMEGNTFAYAFITIAMQLALRLPLVYAALIRPAYDFAIVLCVFTSLLSAVIIAIAYRQRLRISRLKGYFLSLKHLMPYIKYSLYAWPIPLVLYLNVVLMQVLIRSDLGDSAVGIFSSVNVFVGVVNVLQAGFATYWSGYMFENYKTNNDLIVKAHDYLAFFTIMVMAGFVATRDLIYVLLGTGYHASKPLFAMILMYPLLLILSETTAYGISIAKKPHIMLILTVAAVATNIGLSVYYIPIFGLTGACIGAAASAIFLFATQTYYAQKYYKSIDNPLKTFYTLSAVTVLAMANLLLSDNTTLLMSFCAGCIVFSCLVYKKVISEASCYLRRQLLRVSV